MKSIFSMIKLNLIIFTVFLTVLSFALGCAGKIKRVEFSEGTSPSVEMAKLDADIQLAELDQIDVTAPKYFAEAKKKLAEARKFELDGKSDHKILNAVGDGRGALNYAIVSQQGYRSEINDILESREMALKSGALEQSPSEFQRIDWDLKKTMEDYKPNRNYLSQNARQSFRDRYNDLEMKALAASERDAARTITAEELNLDPQQAEVHRDNNRILIRLKTGNFEPGKSEITEEAIPVLDQVKEILSSMDAEEVKIEGFTDATGNDEMNKQLSEERAEAVADYLVSPETVAEDKIQVEGLGASRPVQTNMTKQGRAMNRRVDIIITPTKTE